VINLFQLQSSETLKNLTPELLEEIVDLSRNSLEAMANIFQMGVTKGVFIDRHPFALADTLWALFSGIILWKRAKKSLTRIKIISSRRWILHLKSFHGA
jgi:hypothetical protein